MLKLVVMIWTQQTAHIVAQVVASFDLAKSKNETVTRSEVMQIFNDNDLQVKVLDQIVDQACSDDKQLFTVNDIIGITLKILQLVPQSDSILT